MGPDEEVPREVFLQPVLSSGSPKLMEALSSKLRSSSPNPNPNPRHGLTPFPRTTGCSKNQQAIRGEIFLQPPFSATTKRSSSIFPLPTLSTGLGWTITK